MQCVRSPCRSCKIQSVRTKAYGSGEILQVNLNQSDCHCTCLHVEFDSPVIYIYINSRRTIKFTLFWTRWWGKQPEVASIVQLLMFGNGQWVNSLPEISPTVSVPQRYFLLIPSSLVFFWKVLMQFYSLLFLLKVLMQFYLLLAGVVW